MVGVLLSVILVFCGHFVLLVVHEQFHCNDYDKCICLFAQQN